MCHPINPKSPTYSKKVVSWSCVGESLLRMVDLFPTLTVSRCKSLLRLGKCRRAKVMADVETEFAAYEKDVLSTLSMPTKPSLAYWQNKCDSMPTLSSAALDINCVPMTEVSVERLFSHLNFIFTKRRNRTSGGIIEDVLFLRLNKKYQEKETSD